MKTAVFLLIFLVSAFSATSTPCRDQQTSVNAHFKPSQQLHFVDLARLSEFEFDALKALPVTVDVSRYNSSIASMSGLSLVDPVNSPGNFPRLHLVLRVMRN